MIWRFKRRICMASREYHNLIASTRKTVHGRSKTIIASMQYTAYCYTTYL